MSNISKVHVFKVEMTCEGCSKALTNVLNKNKDQGIKEFNVNLQENKVTIQSSLPVDALTDILKKTGKKITYVEEKKNEV